MDDATHEQGTGIKAAIRARYGPPEAIEVVDVERPECGPGQVVVEVRACSVNPYDWHGLTGTPLIARMGTGWSVPASPRLGVDIAGVVVEVAEDVTGFAVGDAVFGFADGGFADLVAAKAEELVRKPASVSFEDAAAVPIAALTALQGLRTHGVLQAGEHVLINGASGGVGTYAIQLAKHLGATVTAVCSSRNADLVRELGADHVVDYQSTNFTDSVGAFDVVLDNIGNHPLSACKRCLVETGRYVVVSGPKGRMLGPLGHMVRAVLSFAFSTRKAAVFIASRNRDDLEDLARLLEQGSVRSVVEATFPLAETAAAMAHVGSGRTRGKVVLQP